MENQELNLTEMQKLFVEEYIVSLNATEAAKKAGYSEKTANEQGARLLTNTNIITCIQSKLLPKLQKLEITSDKVLQEIAKLAFSNIKEFYNPDGSLKNITELPEEICAAISSLKSTNIVHGKGKDQYVETVKELKLWDKGAALEKLMKYLGLLAPDAQVNVQNNVIIPDEQLKRVMLEVQSETKKKFANIRAKKAEYLENKKK